MKARNLVIALLVCLGCVALAGISAAAGAPVGHSKGHSHPGHPGAGKIKVESIQIGSKVGPLVVRVRGNGESKLKLKVDGHLVRHAFEWDGRHTQIAEPRAEALRPGANELRIFGDGHPAVTRTVKIPGALLRVDAGADFGAPVDAERTIGTAPAAIGAKPGTAYGWSVVRRPRGAKARLHDAHSAQPMLDPTEPGTYVLQEEADPDGNGPAPPNFDQVVVSVARATKPIGAKLNTLFTRDGSIHIGDETLGGLSTNHLAYVVLERSTGATLTSGTVSPDAAGVAQLQGIVNDKTKGERFRYLMIISDENGMAQNALGDLNKLFMSLGAPLLTQQQFTNLEKGYQWSVIGIPGGSAGAATLRIATDSQMAGAIIGNLEQNQGVQFNQAYAWEYVSPEHPPFNTDAEPALNANGENTIEVEEAGKYTAKLQSGMTAGFHVVVLDPLTLRALSNETIPTNSNTIAANTLQEGAGARLEKIVAPEGVEGALVLVQSIGKPKPGGPGWTRIVNVLARLGANRMYLNNLEGQSEYAIVNRFESETPPAEASTAYDHGSYRQSVPPQGRLIGSLSRGRQDAFEPTVSSAPFTGDASKGSVNLELMKLAFQPTGNWPALPGSAAESKKAEEYLCSRVEGCGTRPNQCPTVRECFWQKYEGADWTGVKNDIRAARFPAGQTDFTAATFENDQVVLADEAGKVGAVQRYMVRLKEPLEKSQTRSFVNLKAISKEIYDSLQRPAADNSKAWILGLIGKAVAVGGFFGPPVSTAASGLSATFGLAAFLATESGQPVLGAEVNIKAADLEAEIPNRIDIAKAATRQIGLLIVSDHDKLYAAAEKINSDWALPDGPAAVEKQLELGAKQWFYEAMVPAGYPFLIRANTLNARQLNCNPFHGGGSDWPGLSDADQVQVNVGWDANGNPIRATYFFAAGYGANYSPPASLGEKLFKPTDEGGVGIPKYAFFSPQVFGGYTYHALNGQEHCQVGFLPPRG